MRQWGVWRRALVMGVGLSVLAAGLASMGDAAYPGRNGRIAFALNADVSTSPQSCLDIFSVNPNGSDRHRLTQGCPWLYSDPAYSAGGNLIAFVRGYEPFPRGLHGAGIYVMDADGSNIRRITTSRLDGEPAISPQGNWILFDRFLKRQARTQLFLASTEGGGVRQLTHGNGAADPTFSPDGRQIAFVGGRSNIFTMGVRGSHTHRLTHSPARLDRWYGDPDYSPDGRHLVVECGEGEGFGSVAQICLMRADGTHLKHLTPQRGWFAEGPVFSPDGQQIAFLAQPRSSRDVIIYTMSTDGSHLRRVYDLGPHQELGSLGITWQPLP